MARLPAIAMATSRPDDRRIRPREPLAWLPLVLAALAIVAALAFTSTEQPFEPPYLLPALNLVFLTGVSLLVAWLAARSYLEGGFVSVLLLGSGMLAFGLGGGLAAVSVAWNLGSNVTTTAHNLGAFVAALCCLGSVQATTIRGLDASRSPGDLRACMVAYAVPSTLMTLAFLGAVARVTPLFFSPETGATDLRQFVLIASIAMFFLTVVMFRVLYYRSSVAFLHWYSVGLALIATGLAGVLVQRAVGDPISWAGRVAQYAGGVYLFLAVRSVRNEQGPWRIPFDQMLRETRDRYRRLVQMSPDAITVFSDGKFVFVNPAAVELLGASGVDELLGREVMEFVPPASRPQAAVRIEAMRAGAHVALADFEILRADGTEVDVELTGVPVEFQGCPAVQAVLRNVTERKRLEAALRRQAEQLAEANRLKDEFVANLSHELRTPLNAIVGWAHLLTNGGLDDRMREHAVEVIERNARVQTDLVNDVLDVSRIVSGRLRLNPRVLDVAECLQSSLDAVRPAALARRIQIEQEGDVKAIVVGDPDRLQQVFWNLLSNAVKFTPEGGQVAASVLVQGSSVTISIRDTGIGIRPEFIDHVFDRFRQADASSSRRHAGLGLGLAIARHLVELHGGQVAAESDGEGRGSVFRVTLPLAETAALS